MELSKKDFLVTREVKPAEASVFPRSSLWLGAEASQQLSRVDLEDLDSIQFLLLGEIAPPRGQLVSIKCTESILRGGQLGETLARIHVEKLKAFVNLRDQPVSCRREDGNAASFCDAPFKFAQQSVGLEVPQFESFLVLFDVQAPLHRGVLVHGLRTAAEHRLDGERESRNDQNVLYFPGAGVPIIRSFHIRVICSLRVPGK